MNIIRQLQAIREEMSKVEFDAAVKNTNGTEIVAAIRELMEIEAISRYLIQGLKIK